MAIFFESEPLRVDIGPLIFHERPFGLAKLLPDLVDDRLQLHLDALGDVLVDDGVQAGRPHPDLVRPRFLDLHPQIQDLALLLFEEPVFFEELLLELLDTSVGVADDILQPLLSPI